MMPFCSTLSHTLKIRAMLRRRTFGRNDITVISGTDPHYSSQSDLEDAVAEEKTVIVIRDQKLANRTVLWLQAGKCLDGMTMAAALGSMIFSVEPFPGALAYGKPLAVCGVLMYLGYQAFWSPNALAQYKIAQGPDLFSILKGQYYPSTMLVRHAECKRNVFYGLTCAAAMAMAFWNDISSYNFEEALDKLKNLNKQKE